MIEILQYDFGQRALLAGLLVGLTAPLIGVFLIQRRLALIGDGIGHVALVGVAAGVLTGTAPVWTALAVSVAAAITLELIRSSGRTGGDVALAALFYGGIGGGVLLLSVAPAGTPTTLTGYLFGAITTTSSADIIVFAVMTVIVLVTVITLAPRLFAVASDPDYSRAVGLPVLALNLALATLTAVTVVVSMRIVGLLLISALMVLPAGIAQHLARSFRATLVVASLSGGAISVAGIMVSFAGGTPSGATIVVLAVAVFVAVSLGAALWGFVFSRWHQEAEHHHEHEHGADCGHPAIEHDGHVDYLHNGHLHAQHGDHYDEHDHPVQESTHVRREPDSALH
ncbi:MAG: metal ABC transporter permease [Actinomycetota bacterium]